jgi:serine phosphatase RsbU (regulator of sigma subunit)
LAASEFFRESLATFEIATRAFREAQEAMRLEQVHAAKQEALAEAAVQINQRLDPRHILHVTAERAMAITEAAGAAAEIRLEGEAATLSLEVGEPAGPSVSTKLLARDRRELGTLTAHAPQAGAHTVQPMLTQLAEMASIGIENAQRYQRERHVAETLQRSLLPPRLPDLPGMKAGDGIHVGGDFYDVFKTASGDWAVLIGDVCGKGPAAASLTALTRYTARAAGLHEHSPSAILQLLNAAMIEQRTDGRFATVLCAFLTPLTGAAKIVCASGGHPLPLVLRADGRVETIGVGGTLLGVIDDPALPDSEGELHAGDTLLLYTDGVIEVRKQRQEIFGASDLAALLSRSAGLEPEEILIRIREEVEQLSGGPLHDDVALLALRVRG